MSAEQQTISSWLDAALTALNEKDREIERLKAGIEKAAIVLEDVQMPHMAEALRKMADKGAGEPMSSADQHTGKPLNALIAEALGWRTWEDMRPGREGNWFQERDSRPGFIEAVPLRDYLAELRKEQTVGAIQER